MISSLKFFSFFLICLLSTANISAKETLNYGDISIKAEHVTLNKFTNKLLLKTNIQIKFAFLIYKKEREKHDITQLYPDT